MTEEAKTYTSVWNRPARKERSTLRREQIVAKAAEILDAEGFEALSMRKLAAELDAGTTSLYWHVANRDELMELIIDELYGEIELPDPANARPWREDVEGFARSVRQVILRHSWVSTALEHLATAHLGPNVKRLAIAMLTTFTNAGWDVKEAERALGTVSSYVTGSSLSQAAWTNRLRTQGQTAQDWMKEDLAVMGDVSNENAMLGELVESYEGADVDQNMSDDFEFGLARVLDGLQAHLDASK
jgi:AcrR family transcriptional regulator